MPAQLIQSKPRFGELFWLNLSPSNRKHCSEEQREAIKTAIKKEIGADRFGHSEYNGKQIFIGINEVAPRTGYPGHNHLYIAVNRQQSGNLIGEQLKKALIHILESVKVQPDKVMEVKDRPEDGKFYHFGSFRPALGEANAPVTFVTSDEDVRKHGWAHGFDPWTGENRGVHQIFQPKWD